MALTAKQEMQHIGETKACADHAHDLVHELSNRLDAVWRYDQYIANAEGDRDLQNFWQARKEEDLRNIDELKQLISAHVKKDCF